MFELAKNIFKISIHALRGEGDLPRFKIRPYPYISIHALRGEGDLCHF